MIALIIFFFASFGLSFILGQSRITMSLRVLLGGVVANPPYVATSDEAYDAAIEAFRANRKAAGKDPFWDYKPLVPVIGPLLVALWECPGCLGWWIGAVVGAVHPEFLQLNADGIDALVTSWWSCAVVLGLATAGMNMLLAKLAGTIE